MSEELMFKKNSCNLCNSLINNYYLFILSKINRCIFGYLRDF